MSLIWGGTRQVTLLHHDCEAPYLCCVENLAYGRPACCICPCADRQELEVDVRREMAEEDFDRS